MWLEQDNSPRGGGRAGIRLCRLCSGHRLVSLAGWGAVGSFKQGRDVVRWLSQKVRGQEETAWW